MGRLACTLLVAGLAHGVVLGWLDGPRPPSPPATRAAPVPVALWRRTPPPALPSPALSPPRMRKTCTQVPREPAASRPTVEATPVATVEHVTAATAPLSLPTVRLSIPRVSSVPSCVERIAAALSHRTTRRTQVQGDVDARAVVTFELDGAGTPHDVEIEPPAPAVRAVVRRALADPLPSGCPGSVRWPLRVRGTRG